jgi:uncharacterized protein (DUF3084 family)
VNKETTLFGLIEDRDGWISERDENIESLNKKVEETIHNYLRMSAELETQQALANNQAKWIKDRDEWIAERDAIIQDQQEWIQDRDTWIQERDQIIQHLQNDIHQLRDSHSYRFGRKLISLFQPLKKIIKREHYA